MTEYQNNFLYKLSKRYSNRTTDFKDLKRFKNIPVFVYGSLKKDGFFHDAIDKCAYLGRAVTAEASYEMRASKGDYPVVLKSKDNKDRGRISGEVYIVNPLLMLELDRIEGNNFMYTRQKLFVRLLDQTIYKDTKKENPFIEAWVYIGNPEYWDYRDCPKCFSSIQDGVRTFTWSNSSSNYYEQIFDNYPYRHWN